MTRELSYRPRTVGGVLNRRKDRLDGFLQPCVLPHPHDAPAGVLKRGVRLLIALDVPAELGSPVPLVAGGLPSVHRTHMPEAPVHEHGDLAPGEHDVGSDPGARQIEPMVLPEAEAASVQCGTELDLGLRVDPAVGLHVAGPTWTERLGLARVRCRFPVGLWHVSSVRAVGGLQESVSQDVLGERGVRRGEW